MSTEQMSTAPSPPTLAAFAGDELRARIFSDKYALRDVAGSLLEQTPDQMWQRVARELAVQEVPDKRQQWHDEFVWLLSGWRMGPGGRILHALGNPNKVTALNCYVSPAPHDSIRGIYHTAGSWLKRSSAAVVVGSIFFTPPEKRASSECGQDVHRRCVLHGVILTHNRSYRAGQGWL